MKSGAKFKPQLAAAALVEAAYSSDEKAAEHWGVTARTLYNWRERLETDPEFSAIFQFKKEQFEMGWRDELGSALRAGIDFLKRAAQSADITDPQAVYSVAGAVKILADVRASMDVLDARLADFNREARQADHEMAAKTQGRK